MLENPLVTGIIGSVVGGAIIALSQRIQWKHLSWVWLALRNYNRLVRVSLSYLVRIRIGDHYLLVRGVRIPDQWQPVGGVYKFHEQARSSLARFHLLDDALMELDAQTERDLRVRVKGRHLLGLMRWFESNRGREQAPWREFYEELVAQEILTQEAFPHIEYAHVGRRSVSRYSDWAQGPELLVADVFELLPSPAQLAEIEQLIEYEGEDFIWAAEETIMRLGATPGDRRTTRIAMTAQWLV